MRYSKNGEEYNTGVTLQGCAGCCKMDIWKEISPIEAQKLVPSRRIVDETGEIRKRLLAGELFGYKRDGKVELFNLLGSLYFGQYKEGKIQRGCDFAPSTMTVETCIDYIQTGTWGFFSPLEQKILNGAKIGNCDGTLIQTLSGGVYLKWSQGKFAYYDAKNDAFSSNSNMIFPDLVTLMGGVYDFIKEPTCQHIERNYLIDRREIREGFRFRANNIEYIIGSKLIGNQTHYAPFSTAEGTAAAINSQGGQRV